ncbi:MAG: molybdenum cofactor guanylyltransferase [Byssovorax sp.]
MSGPAGPRIPSLAGIVLCGGKSERMGTPKAALPFGGELLLQRVVRAVSEAASPVVVVAAPGQEIPALPGHIEVARDAIAGRGPLQGIAAGLDALTALSAQSRAAFITSTDLPFLHPALIRRLHALLDDDHDIIAPRAGGHLYPLPAVYVRAVQTEVTAMLAAGTLRLTTLLERSRTLVAGEATLLHDDALSRADPALRSLWNVNTPEEYEAALRALGGAAD